NRRRGNPSLARLTNAFCRQLLGLVGQNVFATLRWQTRAQRAFDCRLPISTMGIWHESNHIIYTTTRPPRNIWVQSNRNTIHSFARRLKSGCNSNQQRRLVIGSPCGSPRHLRRPGNSALDRITASVCYMGLMKIVATSKSKPLASKKATGWRGGGIVRVATQNEVAAHFS